MNNTQNYIDTIVTTASPRYVNIIDDYTDWYNAVDWKWETINNVTYGCATFNKLYNNIQTIAIAKYSQKELYTDIYCTKDNFKKTNYLADEVNAVIAINGSYFDRTKNKSITAIWINGEELSTTQDDMKSRCTGILGFKNGIMKIMKYDAYNTTSNDLALLSKKYDSLFVTGPLLHLDGVSADNIKIESSSFNGYNPRTMIGYDNDGMIYMVVVEGRNDEAKGLKIQNMINLAEDLNLVSAINVDGGSSSILYIKNVGNISRPSNGYVFRIPNIIYAKLR